MSVKGITFDEQSISAANMAHFMKVFSGNKNGITRGCTITHDTSKIYISAGYMLIEGRQVQIVGTQEIALKTVSTGELYCDVVFQIDLSKTNTESSFVQGTFETKTSSSGWPTLTQQDIDGTGTMYQYSIARYHVTASGIDSYTQTATTAAVDWMSESKFRKVGSDLYID